MSIIGMWGFEGNHVLRDGFSVQSGTPAYVSDVPGGGSALAMSGTGINGSLVLRSPLRATAGEFWIHARWKPRSATNGESQYIGWAANTGLRGFIRLQNTTLLPQLVVNGVLQATGTASLSLGVWNRLHIHVVIGVSGSVTVYKDGNLSTAILSFSGNTDPFTEGAMDEAYFQIAGSTVLSIYLDDVVYMNPNDAQGVVDVNEMINVAIRGVNPNADGVHTAWTASPGNFGTDYQEISEDASLAAAVQASNRLIHGVNFVDGDQITIGAKTYTFQATLTDVDGNVKVGGTAGTSMGNLYNAINLGGGGGTAYAASMTLHPTVEAYNFGSIFCDVRAKVAGSAGNLIATTEAVPNVDCYWRDGATLVGGLDLPDDGYVRATATSQVSTYGFENVVDGVVLCAKGKARILRGDATAGAQVRFVARQGGVDYPGPDQAAPGDGDVFLYSQAQPAGGAWDTASFNAVEWGMESRP